MSFCIQTHNMPRINCFAEAERVWNEAKPWRYEHASWRPLDSSRKKHMRIVKLRDDRGYECVLHNLAVVTYYADGNVALRCYDSVSTSQFAWCVRPKGCANTSTKGRMFWQVETDHGPCFYREASEALVLQPTANAWKLTTLPSEEHEWAYDPKKGADVRKRLKPYAAWYAVLARLGATPKKQLSYSPRNGVECFLGAYDQTEHYVEFARVLGSPKDILPVAYETTGARYKSLVPHNRLPRSFA